MKTIVIASAHAATTATIIGRIKPLSEQLSSRYRIHLLVLGQAPTNHQYHSVGNEPFTRTPAGKKRLRGIALVLNMLMTAWQTFRLLNQLEPDYVIISKPLPANTLGTAAWHYLGHYRIPIILDTDDFELTANQLTSIWQRAVLHWAERTASHISRHIIVATPFLEDHFTFLTNRPNTITHIPTGVPATLYIPVTPPPAHAHLLYIGSVSVSSGHRVDMLPNILHTLHQHGHKVHLTIAGDGDDITTLTQAFQAAGLSQFVTWYGRFSLDETPQLIKQATIILDPIDSSIAQRAKSSFRVLAAAAQGRAVITSNVGIRPALLPDTLHHRFFATPASSVQYAAACRALLEQPLTSTERQALQHHARQFSWDILAPRYEQAITSLTST